MAITPSFRAARQQKGPGKNLRALIEHMSNPAHPAWAGAIKYNEFTGLIEICGPWPPQAGRKKHAPEPLDEVEHLLRIQKYFQDQEMNVSKFTTFDALQLKSRDDRYHPVRDYLGNLAWDRTERLHLLCEQYFGAILPAVPGPERESMRAYLAMVGRNLMVSAVARIYQPGCKVDHVPVLVGHAQGEGKSQALRELCPVSGWFTDNIGADPSNKDTKDALIGKWIVELAEMHVLTSHPEALKSFITTQVDRFRQPYGRNTVDYPRQCVLVGTTNELRLPDETGNRRFWPFRVNTPNLSLIRQDRDQLWAEAAALYSGGEKWWADTPENENIFRSAQADHREYDLWEGKIFQWVTDEPDPFTMDAIFAAHPYLTDEKDVGMAHLKRMGKCLRRLGFIIVKRQPNGARSPLWGKAQVGP